MNNVLTKNKMLSSTQKFYSDVIKGLKSSPKSMSSKYFYDQQGDQIFQQIMAMDEYYLTDCEMEILKEQAAEISKTIALNKSPFDLIELGAGDATKSIHLLKQLIGEGQDFRYMPIDISENVIRNLETKLPQALPDLNITGLNGDYFDMLNRASEISDRRKVVLFMGANIGNMTVTEARAFCTKLKSYLAPDDLLIIGFDLKKNPHQILAAYSDKQGITKSFNINLLHRINRELGGDFETENFDHYASYDPESGACKSYLISLKDQVVRLGDTESVSFLKNEYIYMEISQKYSLQEINQLMSGLEFTQVKNFFDSGKMFVDSIWKMR
ncbi:hypothetical protein PBAL39_23782 [Pedobacter sp. BAL39]|uniref:L-histidine N(alpha)-methyltransferase n=1 Tax=Pedobacter sp. BAL39 TaxID=391596 RepID=UPI000155953D|nr:L-histidine N(alpha)-methyltransferase [Pedobacter sp. BAL39]EDM36082.1 hypothetical protein PBAL39_23782 [Pedobacter sp. BAL39]